MIRELICYKCECSKCGHSWTTRNHELPVNCAKCKTTKWNDDYEFNLPQVEQIAPVVVEPVADDKQATLAALRQSVAAIESGEQTAQPVTDNWIEDKPTFENGELLYWHHKPKQKPACYKREIDWNSA